jgi:hypothetical protein
VQVVWFSGGAVIEAAHELDNDIVGGALLSVDITTAAVSETNS